MHGVPNTIVSNTNSKFTSNFWKGLFKGFGTSLNFSTTYHLESNGQIKRVNWVIEDMLRMYVMDKPSKWEEFLHLIDFSYNNGYQAYLKIIPFNKLNGRKCNTIVSWDNLVNYALVGPDFLQELEEKMVKKMKNLKDSQDWKKICANKGRTHREF